jgi:hypothetical protein
LAILLHGYHVLKGSQCVSPSTSKIGSPRGQLEVKLLQITFFVISCLKMNRHINNVSCSKTPVPLSHFLAGVPPLPQTGLQYTTEDGKQKNKLSPFNIYLGHFLAKARVDMHALGIS